MHEASSTISIPEPVEPEGQMQRVSRDLKSVSPKVALICTGLGNIERGFETSTARWFEALKKHTALDVRLYCGGPFEGGKQLWNLPRNSIWTRPAYYVPFVPEKQKWEFTYGVEQVSFWSALNFELIAWKPDVVWVKDFPLVHLLAISRKMFGLKYKIIFANGGLKDPSSYKDIDFIQQIQRDAYFRGLDSGIPEDKMNILPNCFPELKETALRSETRFRLGLDENDFVIVCVAAWNRYHKRIDYLLEEVAAIKDPRVKLVLCGTPEVDTNALKAMGRQLLGDRVQWLTVGSGKVIEILQASDVFVLPALDEMFGNAPVEAVLCGVPIVTHPHNGVRYSIQDDFWMTDLSIPGNLTKRLQWMRENTSLLKEKIAILKAEVSSRFSEETLAPQFQNMVLHVVRDETLIEKCDAR